MDQLEPEEATNSVTESSQEWHILNLLRVCERDLFESNLQEFRKIQLTESQDGKVRLCKLINEILRLDPQYSIILVEDLSHLFNDSNFLVQKSALVSLVDCFNILFSHIIASNEALETVRLTGTLDSISKSQITRCKHATSINGYSNNVQGTNHYNASVRSNSGLNGVPNSVKGNEEENQEEENLPFSLDNIRVTESFADFACIRFMVHTRLLECDFSDVKYSSPHFLPTLIHNRTKLYPVNLLKMLFYELANYPSYLCNQCVSEPENSEGLEANKVKSKKKKVKGVKTEETNLDIYETLYKWHSESVSLLKILITKHKYSGMDGNKKVKKGDGLAESVLSCEVACSLIGFYPEYYFEEFADVLVSLLRTQSHTVFEPILFRIFSFSNCYRYHHLLLDKVNEKGYGLELENMYKLVQTLPSVSCEAYRGTMMAVDNTEAPNKETNYELSDNLVTSLSVEVDEKLNLYPAAQIFEFDKELVKNYKSSKFKNSQINISNNFYKRKPVNITPISYEQTYTDEAVEDGKVRAESEKLEKKLKIVEESAIRKNEKLFVRLVGNQMIDTVSSYQRFLKFEVIGAKVVNFDKFASLVLKHFLVSNLIKFENRKEVLRNLLDYLAEHTLINHAENHILKSLKHHSGCYGLSLLFNCVNKQNSAHLFNKFLEELNRHITFSYTTNFAKSTSSTDQSRKLKYMDEYETFVNLCLSYVSEKLSETEEVSDISVNALSKFVLSLPKIPDKMSDLILVWVNSENQGNLKLAFSLVSNLLKHSSLVKRVDYEELLGKDHFRYISNMLLVKRSVFAIFLTCITSQRKQVSSLFLRLLSSQKGLYNVKYNYTVKSFRSVHEEFVTKLKEFNGSDDEKDLVEDCLYLSDRPLWQWPPKLVVLATQLLNFNLSHVLDCYEDVVDEGVVDEGYDDGDEDIGVWIEESVGLMCSRNSLKTSKFIKDAVKSLFNELQDNSVNPSTDDKFDKPEKDELDADKSDELDKDEFEVIMEDVEKEVSELDLVYFEPMLSCCIKNSRLVFRLCSLANSYPGTHFYTKCSLTLSNYQRELQLIIKYNEEYMSLVESVLEEMRKSWCNVMFKFDERTSLEKNLMKLLMEKMSVTPEYVIQMSPFLTPEQLNKLLAFLFRKYEKDKIVKVLDVIIETPKVSLPQHFLYSIYNMPTTQTSTLGPVGVSEGTAVDEKDYMKLQVLLLDTCIKYCTMGRFSVESAISSLYLIVESFDNINFVFGRLLCQFVQKVPLTRKVIVDVIFPKLIQKQCWQDKQLFKGVVITICTLWNHFKDHLLRYILEMPNSNVKTILKALQAQYNISDYFKNITLPDNIQTILQDVINNK